MLGSRNTTGAISMPATAPIAAAMPQPSAIIQPTRMPASRAEFGVGGRRAHREPDAGVAEEADRAAPASAGDADHAGVVGADQAAAEQRLPSRTVSGRS